MSENLPLAPCPVCGRDNPMTGVNGGDCLPCSAEQFGLPPFSDPEMMWLREASEAAIHLALRDSLVGFRP